MEELSRLFVKCLIGILVVIPLGFVAIMVIFAMAAVETAHVVHESWNQNQQEWAQAAEEGHRQEQERLAERVRQHDAAAERCAPIVEVYCHKRSHCDTKELEYICLTDQGINTRNYRQKMREFHHKEARAHAAERHNAQYRENSRGVI